MTVMTIHKDYAPLERLAKEQGWVLEWKGSGHIHWIPPDGGKPVTTSSTPTTRATVDNVRNDLKKAGLVTDPEEWKRIKKRESKIRNAMETRYTHENIITVMSQDTSPAPGDLLPEALTPGQLDAISRMFAEHYVDNGESTQLPTTCGCGRRFLEPFACAMHRIKCDKKAPGETMARTTRPPDNNRLDCPFCPAWWYVGQDGQRAKHMADDHDKAECPACKKTMKPGSLQQHLERTCPKLHKKEPASAVIEPGAELQPVAEPDPAPLPSVPPEPDWGQQPLAPVAPPAPAPAPVAPPPAPEPTPAPPAPPAPPMAPLAADASDDDLFALLNMALGGPVQLTPQSFAIINTWLDATRKLMAMRDE